MKKLITSFCLFLFIFVLMAPVMAKNGGGEEVLGGAMEVNIDDETLENPDSEAEVEAEENYDFESMTTYEMFWPLVAGKIPGDKFYNLKLWRDNLVSKLFFSKLKKSEHLKQLANKRLIEAEKLAEVQRYSYLAETLEVSGDNFEKGLGLLSSSLETESRLWLKGEYVKDWQKYLIVLERMKEQAEGEAKTTIEDSLRKIQNLEEKYSLEITP